MIDLVIEQRRRDLGGFEVGRVLPYGPRQMIGPFIFFDHLGPVDFPRGIPRSVDVRPHPHIGLSTVTYLFDGEIMHRDSLGSEQPIRPGEVNWMTAGRGITHSERFEHARQYGGRTDGIQTWVALPREHEEVEPSFTHYSTAELPSVADGGARIRLIAGHAFGTRSGVKTFSPLVYAHIDLDPGARVGIPAEYPERAVYVASGHLEVDGKGYEPGQMLVLTRGETVVLSAASGATVMLLGGEPIGRRYIEWNFVASSQERIEQAKADWRAGRMKLPDLDNQERIPLPDPPPAANPMS